MTGSEVAALSGAVVLLLGGGVLSGLVPVVNAEAILAASVLAAHGRWWPALVVAMAMGQSGAKVLIFLGARDRDGLLRRARGRLGFRWLGERQPEGTRAGTWAWAGARACVGTRAAVMRRAVRQRLPDPARVAVVVRRPIEGSLLVLGSAVLGLPPLAATSVVAGASRMRLGVFGATCLTGRIVRFTLIALPVAGLPGVVG